MQRVVSAFWTKARKERPRAIRAIVEDANSGGCTWEKWAERTTLKALEDSLIQVTLKKFADVSYGK